MTKNNGCMLLGCTFYDSILDRCVDPKDFINTHTGQPVCRYVAGATEVKTEAALEAAATRDLE